MLVLGNEVEFGFSIHVASAQRVNTHTQAANTDLFNDDINTLFKKNIDSAPIQIIKQPINPNSQTPSLQTQSLFQISPSISSAEFLVDKPMHLALNGVDQNHKTVSQIIDIRQPKEYVKVQ